MATTEFKNAISRRVAPPKLLVGEDESTATSGRAVCVTENGAIKVSLDGESVTIEHADLDVQLKANEATASESDSVLIAGTENGALDGTEHAVKVGTDGTVATASAIVDATVGTHNTDAAPTEVAMVGGKAVDPASMPAAYTAGKIVQSSLDLYGMEMARDVMVPIGAAAAAAPSAKSGVTGRLPCDVTFTIDAGMTATAHPLVGGVTVAITNGGAAAVSATGKAVTLTAKNDSSTTIAAMNVLIAASASVSALIGPLQGTGTDTFDAAVSIAATNLWATGTIPANVLVVLGSDGYYWPASAYNETLGHVAARVHDTDLQEAVQVNGSLLAFANAVAIPAAVLTVVIPWTDVRSFRYVGFAAQNTGANSTTQFHLYGATSAAGANASVAYAHAIAIAAGATSILPEWPQYPGGASAYGSACPAMYLQLYGYSNAGTTINAQMFGKR